MLGLDHHHRHILVLVLVLTVSDPDADADADGAEKHAVDRNAAVAMDAEEDGAEVDDGGETKSDRYQAGPTWPPSAPPTAPFLERQAGESSASDASAVALAHSHPNRCETMVVHGSYQQKTAYRRATDRRPDFEDVDH